MHQYRSFSPYSNAIFAHCIDQTNVTSGFDPIAFFKWHWDGTSDRDPIEINSINIEHLAYIMCEN